MFLNKKTSPRVASEASEILRSNKYGKKPKSVAGSALSQADEEKRLRRGALGIRLLRGSK